MNILITAGNTLTPIDRVRCITNIFTGRTGALIALEAYQRGHQVTLLTSHPEVIRTLVKTSTTLDLSRWNTWTYQSFEDLAYLMEEKITQGKFDAVIHCAAVSDYRCVGVHAPAPGTGFTEEGTWRNEKNEAPRLLDRSAGKVKSGTPELWLRLVRTPKLIDKVRDPWQFRGILVKFKLEVEVEEPQLLEVAETSRKQSRADWMVANALDTMHAWAYLGPFADGYRKLARQEMPAELLATLEACYRERKHG